MSDSSLEKVNDVKLEQFFWGRLLDYGDLEILTVSELGVNRFSQVGQPVRLKTAMLNTKEKLEHSQTRLGHSAEVDISEPLGQLDNLRGQELFTEEEFQQQKAQVLAKLSKRSIPQTPASRKRAGRGEGCR